MEEFEARGQAAKEQAQDSVKALRKGIRQQPAMAMAIATAAGAVLAVIAVPRFAMEMRRRQLSEDLIHRVVFENPVQFLSQSGKFLLPAVDAAIATAR